MLWSKNAEKHSFPAMSECVYKPRICPGKRGGFELEMDSMHGLVKKIYVYIYVFDLTANETGFSWFFSLNQMQVSKRWTVLIKFERVQPLEKISKQLTVIKFKWFGYYWWLLLYMRVFSQILFGILRKNQIYKNTNRFQYTSHTIFHTIPLDNFMKLTK